MSEDDTQTRRTGDAVSEVDSFLVGSCPDCDRDVLTARELADGEVVDICLHCEYRFDEREKLDWVQAAKVDEMGYVIDGYGEDDCETDGGCRGGTCGVQQPGT